MENLKKNSNSEGLWGWWKIPLRPKLWISKQALSALLDAEDAGYKIHLDKKVLAETFEKKIKNALTFLRLSNKNQLLLAKQELLDHLMLVKRLNPSLDGKIYLRAHRRPVEKQGHHRQAQDHASPIGHVDFRMK